MLLGRIIILSRGRRTPGPYTGIEAPVLLAIGEQERPALLPDNEFLFFLRHGYYNARFSDKARVWSL